MVNSTAHDRIRQNLPGVKIIFVLRHTVELLWSHYRSNITVADESLALDAAVAERGDSNRHDFVHWIGMHKEDVGYLAFSRWIPQLDESFVAENVLLIDPRALFSDPVATAVRCFTFLGLPLMDSLVAVNANRSDARPGRLCVRLHGSFQKGSSRPASVSWCARALGRTVPVRVPQKIPHVQEAEMRRHLADEIRYFEEMFS